MHEMNSGSTWVAYPRQHWLLTTVKLVAVVIIMLLAIAFVLWMTMVGAVFIMEVIGSSSAIAYWVVTGVLALLVLGLAAIGTPAAAVFAMLDWAFGGSTLVID